MGHLHRPQVVTPLVYYPREYYYNRPQTVFGPGSGEDIGAPDMLHENNIEMSYENDVIMEFEG